MNNVLLVLIAVLQTGALTVLVKLYSEHVDVRTKTNIMWRWWVKTYCDGKEP